MAYTPRDKRPGRPESTLDRIRRQVLMEEARKRQAERPFDPEAPRTAYAKPHHFAVNAHEAPERAEIVESMARTFFVVGWANAMANAGRRAGGPGENLMDVAPPTPPEAYEFAERAARRIESANHTTLPELYAHLVCLPGKHYREPTPDDFGYSLAMQYVGSGVGWFDNHPGTDRDLKVPHGEDMDVFVEDDEDDEYEENARGAVDEHAATELVLYIDNTSDLSLLGPKGQGRSIAENLMKRYQKGTYDFDKSVTLMRYLVDAGAKRYSKEYGDAGDWNRVFSVPTRDVAARALAEQFRDGAKSGEFSHLTR